MHSQTLNSLGISETIVETRDRMYTFHIYRGTKCAEHVYRNHKPPCALSDQESGIYQVGSYGSPDGDGAILYRGGVESKDEELLPFGSRYTPKPYIIPNPKTAAVRSNEEKGSFGDSLFIGPSVVAAAHT